MTARGDWMQTFTGLAFYPMDPRLEDINIEDISHALSMLCRYGGHTDRFYSVAEHCVHMSRAIEPEHALWALLHDATEAYMGDLIRPLKRAMPNYVVWEDNLMDHICAKFGLEPGMPDAVKKLDTHILVNERAELMRPAPQAWVAIEDMQPHPHIEIVGWEPEVAKYEYLKRFEELASV